MSAPAPGVAAPGWLPVPAARGASPAPVLDRWRRTGTPTAGAWRAAGRTEVHRGSPAVRGHFPDLAVLPGVLVIEAVGRVVELATDGACGPGRLTAVRSVRFLAPLLDGDELDLEVRADAAGAGEWDVRATARRVDGTVAARMRLSYGPDPDAPVADGPPPGPVGPAVREHRDVRAVLPQRHPMLLLDRVLALDPGRAVHAVKAVSATDACYADVGDGAPADHYDYPRSLVVESLGQAAALLWLDGSPAADDGRTLMFAGARDIRFAAPARPGDVLQHLVRLDSVVADTAFASGETWAGGRLVASASSLIATRRVARRPGPVPDPAGTVRPLHPSWEGTS